MKKQMLLAFALCSFILPSAFANTPTGRDIVITMPDVTIDTVEKAQNNEIRITLKNPTINYKSEYGTQGLQAITPEDLASLWTTKNSAGDSFPEDAPNASLSFWDANGEFIQTDFVIQNVQREANELIMIAKLIQNSSTKIAQNNKQATVLTVAQLQKESIGAKKNSIVMLVDSSPFGRSPFDPRH